MDRGNEFDELVSALSNVKALITFGQTKEKLAKTAKKANVETILLTETIEEAVKNAYEQSKQGDVILLSPACASWDQFNTFEERGERFVQAVDRLEKKEK